MRYTIEIARPAQKQLNKLDPSVRKRLADELTASPTIRGLLESPS